MPRDAVDLCAALNEAGRPGEIDGRQCDDQDSLDLHVPYGSEHLIRC